MSVDGILVQAGCARHSATRRRRAHVRRLIGEPLLHFLVLGGLIVAAGSLFADPSERPEDIVVTSALVERLSHLYRLQTGASPDDAKREWLVQNWLREEVMVREAKALHLDVGDELVRRRLVQKLEFLQADAAAAVEPDEAALRTFHQAHADRFVAPARVSFSHRFFSPDRSGPDEARAEAEIALRRLAAVGDGAAVGDPFPLRLAYVAMPQSAVWQVFGRYPIASALFEVPEHEWAGPFKSGFGWHLVKVTERSPARMLSFEQARPAVIEAWQAQQRQEIEADRLEELKRHYRIVRQDAAPASSP